MLYRLRPLFEPLAKLLARPLLSLGISPNTVTKFSLLLAVLASLSHSFAWYCLAFSLAFFACASDFLDGAMAREGQLVSDEGDLLDALIDRLVELVLLLAWAGSYPRLTGLAIGLSLLVSYIKARTGLIIDLDNADWPSLGGRVERVLLILLGYLFPDYTLAVLISLALLTLLACYQRFQYAKLLIARSSSISV